MNCSTMLQKTDLSFQDSENRNSIAVNKIERSRKWKAKFEKLKKFGSHPARAAD